MQCGLRFPIECVTAVLTLPVIERSTRRQDADGVTDSSRLGCTCFSSVAVEASAAAQSILEPLSSSMQSATKPCSSADNDATATQRARHVTKLHGLCLLVPAAHSHHCLGIEIKLRGAKVTLLQYGTVLRVFHSMHAWYGTADFSGSMI